MLKRRMSAMHWINSLVWRLVVIGFTKVRSSQVNVAEERWWQEKR